MGGGKREESSCSLEEKRKGDDGNEPTFGIKGKKKNPPAIKKEKKIWEGGCISLPL